METAPDSGLKRPAWQPPPNYRPVESKVSGITIFAPAVVEEELETAKTYKCPQCGATTRFNVAAGGVALATHFWGFWVCMVVMTIGELILAPTSSTYAANLAPSDKRGRYMSLYGLTWPVGAGIGPIFGGLLNDLLSPQATWYGGMVVGLIGALIFALLGRHISSVQGLTTPTSAAD